MEDELRRKLETCGAQRRWKLASVCELPVVSAAQFTDAQQKEQLAKLAMARQALSTAPAAKRFKFISAVNDQVRTLPSLPPRGVLSSP